MKLKSLLFGSAAVLAAGTGAQAADLPAPEPVEYVRICDAFGTGFYYIPGTDTCLRISGRVRVEAHYVDSFDNDGWIMKDLNNFTTRARGNLRLDARTQTDLGLVRAFFEYELTVGPGPNSIGVPGLDLELAGNYDGTSTALVSAFIQISNDMGTFTAGHTGSFFDFWGSNTFGTRVGIDDQTGEQTLFAYTFGGGNGFSATISIEDPASSGRRLTVVDGQEWPDLVGNVRIDQGWGSAQVMGMIGQIHAKVGGDDEDELRWAIGAGLNAGLPGGFGFNSQVGYADGALAYITEDKGPVSAGDFVLGPGGDVETNTAWMVRAGITADWTPTLGSSLDASYTDISSDADFLEYSYWAIAANLVWEPVSGLLMGPEVAYINFDYDETIFVDPDDGDDIDDLNLWKVMFRIQRDF